MDIVDLMCSSKGGEIGNEEQIEEQLHGCRIGLSVKARRLRCFLDGACYPGQRTMIAIRKF
jgi:hypothetical protein